MKFFSDIIKKINGFLYVKPKMPVAKFLLSDIIQARKDISLLMFGVLSGEITVLNALKKFPKNIPDDSVNVCFHILVHYEADEEFRKNDNLYREEQDDFLLQMAQILQNGDNLPINIINEYNVFYKESLIYPDINRKTIIERLKKFINI